MGVNVNCCKQLSETFHGFMHISSLITGYLNTGFKYIIGVKKPSIFLLAKTRSQNIFHIFRTWFKSVLP